MFLAVLTANFFELSILIGIVFIHELGHAVVAHHYNWRIKAITLLPFGGQMEVDEHGNRPFKEELLVIIAGPLQHVWMVLLAYLFLQLDWISMSFYTTFFYYNVMILIFNLLPIWPLDGGKLVYIYFSLKRSFLSSHQLIIHLSAIFLILFSIFMLLFNPFNLSTWIIIGFLGFSLYFEYKQKRYTFMRFLIDRYYGEEQIAYGLKPIVVDADTKIEKVLESFKRGVKHQIIVKKNGKESGILDENEVLHAYFSDKLVTASVGDLLYSY